MQTKGSRPPVRSRPAYQHGCGDPDRLGVIYLYVDADLVVTARLHPLKVVDQLRVDLRGGMVVASTLRLVIQFVEDFADILAAVIAGQGEVVDRVRTIFLRIASCGIEASLAE